MLAAAKADGVRITVETCPHYLVLRAEDVPDGATQFKCCPPVRGDANRDALWAGLADGTIDLVVSDHSPSTADRKALGTGDFGARVGRHLVAAARPAAGLDRGPPSGARPGRRRALDGGRARGARRARHARARSASGAAADLVAFAPDDDAGRRRRRGCTTATS